jgi:hypothetical protein
MPSAATPACRRSRSIPKASSALDCSHISRLATGAAPRLARWDKARKASPHAIVLAGQAPNRFAAQPRVLVQGIERHIIGLDQRRDGAITDPFFAVSCRKPDQRHHRCDLLPGMRSGDPGGRYTFPPLTVLFLYVHRAPAAARDLKVCTLARLVRCHIERRLTAGAPSTAGNL